MATYEQIIEKADAIINLFDDASNEIVSQTLETSHVWLIGSSSPSNSSNSMWTSSSFSLELTSSRVSSPSVSPIADKRRRRSYTISEKQDILAKYDETKSKKAIAREFGVSRRVIQSWVKQRESINSPVVNLERRRLNGGGRKVLNVDLERQLSSNTLYLVISIFCFFVAIAVK